MTKQEYLKEVTQLKEEAISDLEELLAFAKKLGSSATFKNYVRAKTIVRHNTFSALYQRADGVVALAKVNQGSAASILLRSMWETLAEYDFINLVPSNLNLEIRLISESKQQLANWTHIQQMRAAHPNAETWQAIISDSKISSTIALRQTELQEFSQKYPSINLPSYQALLSRLAFIDNARLAKNPNLKTLTQFDYRTVYSLLSGDTHSTVIGNAGNSRSQAKISREIRLDAPHHDTLLATHVAYTLLLKFLQNFNQLEKLKQGAELADRRAINRRHEKEYEDLQKKYKF